MRTPLNVSVTGALEHWGVTIEKLLFYSRPGFPVTACLMYSTALARTAPPHSMPAILYASGHEQYAFRSPLFDSSAPQQLALNLALKGFVVLAFDPPSQGERIQYWSSATNASVIGWGVREHQYFGRQMLLIGDAPATIELWDATRALDYLVSRPEVDADRVGMCGCSGGGTQTASLGAIDARLVATSSACYVTTLSRLLEASDFQDAEQNWPGGVARDLDIMDLIEVRAPRPTQLLFTTADQIFPIQGSREAAAEAALAFRALGHADQLDVHEADHRHGYPPANRRALYGFFLRALRQSGSADELDVPPLPKERLFVTSTGQLATALPDARTVHDLLLERLRVVLAAQQQRRAADAVGYVARTRATSPDVAGVYGTWRPPARDAQVLFLGRVASVDAVSEAYVVPSVGACIVPLVVYRPLRPRLPLEAVVVVTDTPDAVNATHTLVADALQQGQLAVVPSLCGFGAIGNGWTDPPYGDGTATTYLALSLNRTVVGLHATQLADVWDFVASARAAFAAGLNATVAASVAFGSLEPALLHAAVWQQQQQRQRAAAAAPAAIALAGSLSTYARLVAQRFYVAPSYADVYAVLQHYDLPDLAAALAPLPLLIIGPTDGAGRPLDPADLQADYAFAEAMYARAGARASLDLRAGRYSTPELERAVARWLRGRGPAASRAV